MRLCKVLYDVAPTVEKPEYSGKELKMVQQVEFSSESFEPVDKPFVSIDNLYSLPEEIVLVDNDNYIKQIIVKSSCMNLRKMISEVLDIVDLSIIRNLES